MATTSQKQKGIVYADADWRSGAQASNMMGSGYNAARALDGKHVGLLDYYMPKFYQMARGDVVNKYHIGLYGPYVDEALRVMDQNTYGDKYDQGRHKTFPDSTDNFRKTLFDQWLALHYEQSSGVLNMYWSAKSVTIPPPTAETSRIMMDSTKQMDYPVITGVKTDNTLTIEVVDDPYLMWYNFFNALFNVQYSPLLLKPRSTLQKINVMVELFTEGLTVGNSMKSIEEREQNPCMTDLVIGQMFEFNSCISTVAPNLNAHYDTANPYTFSVNMSYPNAYQGTFKDQMRYLRDNTTRGVDPVKAKEHGSNVCTLYDDRHSPYGEYNKGFFEVDYGTWQKRYDDATFEAFQPKEYKKFIRSGNAAFKNLSYNYDMHGARRS